VIHSSARAKLLAAGTILLALILAPAPLLPPHRLAEAVMALLGVSWQAAYFLAALGLRACFYGALGVLAAFTVKRSETTRGLLLQIVTVPAVIIGTALLIRSVKVGHLPEWMNTVIPIAACLIGVALGFGLVYRAGKLTSSIAVALVGLSLWGLLGGVPGELSRATVAQLRRLEGTGRDLPMGEARFGALLQAAFSPVPGTPAPESAVEQNRAAILALGLAIGDERLAEFVGLEEDEELVYAAMAIRNGTTLRGDADLPRHFFLSAALAVVESPTFSDAVGLLKEELDFVKAASGFSFNDLAADRAGVRFAVAATSSEAGAKAMQARLKSGFAVDDFMPPVADLPADLTPEQFRRDYGGIGSPRYRERMKEIEARLDRCRALSPPSSGE